jgi:DNA primase
VLEINRETARFFHACLKSPAGEAGLAYLKDRGLSDKTITTYGLGFAPDSWDSLKNHLLKKGFSFEEMVSAAVLVKGRNGSYYDQFRNRVMFPIIDLRGNVIAFGGRVLDDSKPKYLNSADTPVFKKSRNLFSLNFAKTQIDNRLILAEGYMDVISIYQAGFHNVVATLGTALTPEQARLMSQYAKEIVIAYDSDEAGQAATHRAVNLLDEVGVTTKVLTLSGAKDPDEYIKKYGATRFKLLVEGANNVTEFEIAKLKSQFDINTDSGKVEFLKKAVGLLSELRNPLEREVYAGKIATELSVSRETILVQANSLIQKKQKAKQKKDWKDIESNKAAYQDRVNPQRARFLKQAKAEEGIILYLFKNPDSLSYILSKISEEDFVTAFNKRIFGIFSNKIQNNITLELVTVSGDFNSEEMGRISGMLAASHGMNYTKSQLDDYIDVLLLHKNKVEPKEMAQMSAQEIFERIKRTKK